MTFSWNSQSLGLCIMEVVMLMGPAKQCTATQMVDEIARCYHGKCYCGRALVYSLRKSLWVCPLEWAHTAQGVVDGISTV